MNENGLVFILSVRLCNTNQTSVYLSYKKIIRCTRENSHSEQENESKKEGFDINGNMHIFLARVTKSNGFWPNFCFSNWNHITYTTEPEMVTLLQ